MTPEELKTNLIAEGWRTAPEPSQTGIDWYAYRYLAVGQALDCTSNEKPPSLILKPWALSEGLYRSVEFSVTGEVGGDQWITLKVYSVPMDQAIETFPRAAAILLAAWNAAAALEVVYEHE